MNLSPNSEILMMSYRGARGWTHPDILTGASVLNRRRQLNSPISSPEVLDGVRSPWPPGLGLQQFATDRN